MNGQTTRTVCLADAFKAKPFDISETLRGLANKWARRHGRLLGTLDLIEIDLRHGDIASAQDRIAKALERDAANA